MQFHAQKGLSQHPARNYNITCKEIKEKQTDYKSNKPFKSTRIPCDTCINAHGNILLQSSFLQVKFKKKNHVFFIRMQFLMFPRVQTE